MQDRRVARRYARALFQAATNLKVVDGVESDLGALVKAAERDPAFRSMLSEPFISREEKLEIVDRAFGDRITAVTLQALRLLIEKRRENELGAIHEDFVALRRRAEGVLFVHVDSAMELDADQRERLLASLAQKLDRKVEAEFHVDPSLMGGVRATFENTVLDGTVKGSLAKLREQLRYDLLKQA